MTTTGRLIGTITDPTGAVVVGADVKAVDEATGKSYETKSGNDGGFVFPSLQPGSYTITVTMQGFKKSEVRALKIVVGGQHGLTIQLQLGEVASTVVIEGGTEVLQTTETKVGTTITGKAITQLPFTSRDTLDLATLMPGAATTGRPRTTEINGLPRGSINITMDGINIQDNELKSGDGFFALIRPRIDAIEEFSISTAAASAAESGEGAVQIRFETKRGSNDFHGGAWWYFRNDKFNSNFFFNNEKPPGQKSTPKQKQRLNQFGVKVGGPIIKDKLFFFTALDMYRNPQSLSRTRTILTDEASQGLFRYPVSGVPAGPLPSWVTCTATSCVARLIGAGSMAQSFGFTNTIDTFVAGELAAMNTVVTASGVTTNAAPSLYQRSVSFNNGGAGRRNFPDFRFDYNLNKNHSITAIYHYNYFTSTPDFLNGFDPTYPIAPFNGNLGSQISNRNELVSAWRWNIGTNKTNELRAGLVSSPVSFFPDLKSSLYPQTNTNLGSLRVRPALNLVDDPLIGFDIEGRNGGVFQLIDTFSWSRGKHNFTFGGNWTEVYLKQFNASAAVGNASLGITSDDPADGIFGTTNLPGSSSSDQDTARALYGMLAGRVTDFSGAVNLDLATRQFTPGVRFLENVRQTEIGLYGTDNWRLFSSVTMNLGVRWEYQAAPRDTENIFFRMAGDPLAAIAGRSGNINRLFQPGSLTGTLNSYVLNGDKAWYNRDLNNFAPSVGIAWQPSSDNSTLKWILGGPGKSVFRAGYSINLTRDGILTWEGISTFNGGYQGSLSSTASDAAGPGNFVAGSVLLSSGFIPNVITTPPSFVTSFGLDPVAGQSVNVYDPNLKVPYVQSWSVGWQRELTPSTVIEARYVGNHAVGLWRQSNINEVNIFQPGMTIGGVTLTSFFDEFKAAQNNLAICRATPACATTPRFSNQGLAGQVNLPIMTAAFTGSFVGSQTNSNFSSASRISNLDNGLAGTFAGVLSGWSSGSLSFQNRMTAAGIPANFFLLNPDAALAGAYILRNGAQSTYNALQIEVRRKPTKGLQFNGSYVFSKALTNYYSGDSSQYADVTTFRNIGYDKGPAPADLRHAFKMQLIYELPFGPGHKWSTSSAWVNHIIGGWEINTITRWQTGRTFQLTGGLGGTFNQYDGGVQLIGVTPNQIQDQLSIRKTADGKVYWFPASLIGSDNRANTAIMKPCSTPGAFCQRLFLHGPAFIRADWTIGKRTRITEKVNLEYRAEFLNAFNNANFLVGGSASATTASMSLRSTSFGRITSAYQDISTTDDNGGRIIQMVLRLNF